MHNRNEINKEKLANILYLLLKLSSPLHDVYAGWMLIWMVLEIWQVVLHTCFQGGKFEI